MPTHRRESSFEHDESTTSHLVLLVGVLVVFAVGVVLIIRGLMS